MGNPAIGILHKNPEADLNQELLKTDTEEKWNPNRIITIS